MSLDRRAVAEANERLWIAHPNRRGQALSRNPEDAALRAEWLRYYVESKLGTIGAPTALSTNSSSAVQSCQIPAVVPDRRFLCVRSNAPAESKNIDAGHAMLSLHEGLTITTYGAWPDDHPDIQAAGLANQDETDIRVNFSRDDVSQYPYARCRELTESQFKKFQEELAKPFSWGSLNNCAAFASETFSTTTSEKVRARDLFMIPTPRALTKYIEALNSKSTGDLPP